METNLRPISGYVGVVDHLRREISLGRILPGERLPPERKLAEQLGVARETLRQALRVLEGSGQVTITRGAAGGAIVQDSAPNPDRALHELRERGDELFALVEYRLAIESVAAGLAAERRSEENLTAMEEAQEQLAHATNKYESRRADTAFHLAVANAARNPYFANAIEDARAAMFDPVDLASFEFVMESSHSQHHQIITAIRSGDRAAAEDAMRAHVNHTRDEVAKLIGTGQVTS
jgi:DNA-binding FadR family transcriptional regulator